jgi:hypothetical protein
MSARSAKATLHKIHEVGLRHAGMMREDAHDSPQKSRAAPGTPFVLRDFFVLMICTLAFPWDNGTHCRAPGGMKVTSNLQIARLQFPGA